MFGRGQRSGRCQPPKSDLAQRAFDLDALGEVDAATGLQLNFTQFADHFLHDKGPAPENLIVDADDNESQDVITKMSNNIAFGKSNPEFYKMGPFWGWRLSNDVAMPWNDDDIQRSTTVSAHFHRFGPKPVAQWQIELRMAVTEKDYDTAEAKPYMMGMYFDREKLVNAMFMGYHMPLKLAESLCPYVSLSCTKFDNSALYVYLILNACQLHDYEKMGIKPTATPRTEGRCVVRDFSADGVLAGLIDDLDTYARIVVSHKLVNLVRLGVLSTIANGFPAWTVPQGDGMYHHVMESLKAPSIPIAIYSPTSIDFPEVPSTNPHDYLDMAITLARARDELPDLARAHVRAATIINGRIFDTSAAPNAPMVFEMCTLERYTTTLPVPFDPKWVWNCLGITPTPITTANFRPVELDTVNSLWSNEAQRVGILIASLMSVAIGTVLNHNNIGGEELANAIMNNPNKGYLRSYLYGFLNAKNNQGPPLLLREACGYLARAAQIVIHPTCFPMKKLIAMHGGMLPSPVTPETEWTYSYGRRIPYQVSPLVTLQLFKYYHPCWGIIKAGYMADVWHAMIERFKLDRDDMLFDEMCFLDDIVKTRKPHIYSPHFVLALNALLQHLPRRPKVLFALHMVPLKGRPRLFWDESLLADIYEPTYNKELRIVEIGSMRTYCWERDWVIVLWIRGSSL